MKRTQQLQWTLGVLLALMSCFSLHAQDIIGSWHGSIEVQGTEMPLVFNVMEEEGTLKSTMDSPSQGATDIPMDETSFEEGKLTIAFKKAGIKYVGELKGENLEGTFSQGGMELPLKMEKKEKTSPGNPSLVSSDEELLELAKLDVGDYRYKVEDYFARPKASTFRFSPDGRYMSYREKDENGKRHVMVKEIATGAVKRAIEEKEELVRAYGWISNERLAYLMDTGGDENYHVYAVNLDGSALKDLTPFEGVRAEFTELLKEDKNHIIVSLNKNNPQVFEPYKVNVVTGKMEQLFTNDDPTNPIVGYDFDKDGGLKAYTRMRDGVEQDLFYEDGKGGYSLIKSLNWKDSFGILEFNYATENPHDAYVVSNLTNDKAEIILYDLKEDKILSKVFSNDRYDVDDMSTSRKRGYELDFVSYEGEKTEIIPISAHYKKLHDKIVSRFPEKQYIIADATDEEDQLLIFVQSD
ncbi:MAG: hypothetical protein AAGL29_06200 [Bacteroidota bacterium]